VRGLRYDMVILGRYSIESNMLPDSENCIQESYIQNKKRQEYANRQKYIEKRNCCNEKSCALLSNEYGILKNECNDIFQNDENKCNLWKDRENKYASEAKTYDTNAKSAAWQDFLMSPITPEKRRKIASEYVKYKRVNEHLVEKNPPMWSKKENALFNETNVFAKEFNNLRRGNRGEKVAKELNRIAEGVDKKLASEEKLRNITRKNTRRNRDFSVSEMQNKEPSRTSRSKRVTFNSGGRKQKRKPIRTRKMK